MDNILFDQDSGATIHVNAVRILDVAVCRIAARSNVVYQIAAYHSIARLVDGRIGCRAFKTDDVDADVVVVVHDIMCDSEICDVPVHDQRLARTGLEVMHLIAVNDQVSDRSLGIGTVYRNAKSVAAASRSIAARESLFNVMDVVLQKLYMGTGSDNAYPQRGDSMFGSAEVSNFETLDSQVTLVMNSENADSASGSDVLCVQDRRFARIASESHVSIARVARNVEPH